MSRVVVIAEAGVNHNGDMDRAVQMIDVAAAAGADFVKFQTFKAENLATRAAPKAAYQKALTDSNEAQYEMLKRLELDQRSHRILLDHCDRSGIRFLSTPFDEESLAMLVGEFHIPLVKVPSGEITNAPFLLKIAATGLPVVLSTGMATLAEVKEALGVLAFGYLNAGESSPSRAAFTAAIDSQAGQRLVQQKVTVLHCTTEYPAPLEEINLRALKTMADAFGVAVGYSDHTLGISVSLAAVALGARVIEKHFTMDRGLPGPDHKASLEPVELSLMVKSIREIEMALGSPEKRPTPSEIKNIQVARKSLVAARAIRQGELFTSEMLRAKRPAAGRSPMDYWEVLGAKATRNYEKDELVQ